MSMDRWRPRDDDEGSGREGRADVEGGGWRSRGGEVLL